VPKNVSSMDEDSRVEIEIVLGIVGTVVSAALCFRLMF
jgi:hypothetical protein